MGKKVIQQLRTTRSWLEKISGKLYDLDMEIDKLQANLTDIQVVVDDSIDEIDEQLSDEEGKNS